MGKRKYRTVAAVVLAGAALFSPLLCGMTCLEMSRIRPSTATEVASPAMGEFAGKFVGSGVVECLLTRVVLSIDVGDWAEVARVGTWVWVGAEVVRLVRAVRL